MDKGGPSIKIWLDPVSHPKNTGFRRSEIKGIIAMVAEYRSRLLEAWHEYFRQDHRERVVDVRCDEDSLIVDLMDGRTTSVPLAWYPRLAKPTLLSAPIGKSRAAAMAFTGLMQMKI